jgi:hypothetical protein
MSWSGLLALSDRTRNEPRDLYDLWYLFGSTNLRVAEMRAELNAKLALRQRVVAGMEQAIAAKIVYGGSGPPASRTR